MPTFMLPEALKAQQWELAKGHLRALVSLQGSYSSGRDAHEEKRWLALKAAVDAFIAQIEEEGWHE